jgi:hypothetical protein
MDNERSATIKIGGKEYELLLTTRATKEIAKKFGGLGNLGERLSKAENFEEAIDDLIWLITLLANQTILLHNLRNPAEKFPTITTDEVELLTVPSDLAEYKDAILNALVLGTKREITSEDSSKN